MSRSIYWIGAAVLLGGGLLLMLALAATGSLPGNWNMEGYARSHFERQASAPAALAQQRAASAVAAAPAVERPQAPRAEPASPFSPPPEDALPAGDFGAVIRRGEEIFTNTPQAARAFVGNSMRCSSCHLDAGRLADSAPLWAAWVSYPAFRKKTGEVNTFEQRLQGCFQYSMNGVAPPPGDPVLIALQSYAYWLATGATVDTKLVGRGYPPLPKPPQAADYARGQQVYKERCELCHGAGGEGQRTGDGHTVFPALWGSDSFNWGAGMGRVDNAAAFIRANMPLGLAGTLTVQQAWDVALFMDSQERPQDPRWAGSVAQTRRQFHDASNSMYGQRVNGKLLGDSGAPRHPIVPARAVPSQRLP